MKKVFFLVVFLFLITGCEATYDLEISDDKALETTIALERYSSDLHSEGKKTQDTFLKTALPLSWRYGLFPEDPEIIKSMKTYDVENIEEGDTFGLKLTGNFDSKVSFSDSSIVGLAMDSDVISENEVSIKINASKGLNIFNEYENLDKVTINITVNDYSVTSNNADAVNNNVYTWYVTRDNFDDKKIKLNINKVNSIDDTGSIFKNIWDKISKFFSKINIAKISNIEIIVVCALIVILGALVYLFVRKKQTSINKF